MNPHQGSAPVSWPGWPLLPPADFFPPLPPFHLPPFLPFAHTPFSPASLNPLLVYQTNNYYGQGLPTSAPPRLPLPPPQPKARLPSPCLPEIIDLLDSQDQEPIPVPVPRSRGRARGARGRPGSYLRQARAEGGRVEGGGGGQKARADPMEQLQANLRQGPVEVEMRRSKRVIVRPERLRQAEQLQEPLPVLFMRGRRLCFGLGLQEQEKSQVCLSRLRQLRPQVMVGDRYQAATPGLLPQESARQFLSYRRGSLEGRWLGSSCFLGEA